MAAGRPIELDAQAREMTMEANLLNRNGSIDAAPGQAARKKVRSRPGQARAKADAACKAINLALQGGGAHGAFTWGVLDRLLEDDRIVIEGISATSAGAMNATVTAYGISEGGRAGARQALTNFWRRVSHAADLSPLQPTWLDRMMGNKSLDSSPAYLLLDMLTRLMSPYQLNPTNYNPLREVLSQVVDFGALRAHCCPVKLYLSATNVRTGKVKVFGNDEITTDAVLASGCLPFLFQAVEIEGEAYWDGGYMGNPAIYPLIYHCESRDVVIVHINPMERTELPRSASEILNRINEISFNSSLMREMRAINFVTDLIDADMVKMDALKKMNIHSISAEEEMSKLSVASKLNADWGFLCELRDTGRATAQAWLESSFERLGKESTVDIRARYL
jgi:NTE family protein